ncbi:ComF family protein [Sphingorhabdus sp. YGSMI21]|uniref:ComF family protein n=1 Tax=Sphingorhabdus sp. YGSMI21 TaxID=2077182 RepID=UPI001F0C0789|nr:ComF family protein [Sphingorhabdus sp. YGSMI21]
MFRPILDFALPPRCPICGVTVETDNHFCLSCWQQLDFVAKPWCAACGLPLVFDHPGENLCAKCLVDRPAHDGVRAVVRYDDLSSLIAMRLKYGTRLGLAKLIAEQLQKHVADHADNAILVPVPLHRSRLWRRGFNQSVLIGREIARSSGIALDHDVIIRSKVTPPLRGMSGQQRRKTVDRAFALRPEAQQILAGKSVLLVDDVYTSGSTSNACARLLKKAGANQVLVFCWARVIGNSENI